jgi:hypothetical protein
LAKELQAALADEDIELMTQAANLLAPTLADCKAAATSSSLRAGEAAAIALETRHILNECETVLGQAMAQIHFELRRLKRGKRAASLQAYGVVEAGGTLDTSR